MTVGTIHRVVSFGDSLSDRGKMYKRLLWGFIPLAKMSGLEGKSPYGRFTNQYTWLDHWAAVMSESQYIKNLEAKGHSPDEIWELITTNPTYKEAFHNSFSLDNSDHVRYYGEEFYQTYCEGGATAADWKSDFTWDLALGATRKIVNTLENERRLFLEEEKAKFVTPEEKAATLISTFIGANDLITVHDPKSMSEADIDAVIAKTVDAQMVHIQALIDEGYSNFALKNLPNLGLTPRYQQLNKQALGEDITNKYNAKLKEEYEALQARNSNKGLKFNLYDVNKIFDKIYKNPEKYGFDKEKLTTYFKDSEEFKKDGIKHAGGYMFWDEVHPSAKMHKLLEEMIDKKIRYKKVYNSYVVANKEELPTAKLDFDIEETNDEQRLAQIERDVLKDKNKVVFVKIKGSWACYRYDDGRATNHYVSNSRTLELDAILSDKTQKGEISPDNQFTLMKLAIRQNWNRGIYFYKEGEDYKARVIHKPFIPGYHDHEKQSCYEDINLSDLISKHNPSEMEAIKQDLEKLTAQGSGQVAASDSTVQFVESHCQGRENDENKYIIEPAVQGYSLHYRENGPSETDKTMVKARRGTSVLVFPKGEDLVIGYCGRNGYTEQVLDNFSKHQLQEQLTFESPDTLHMLKRSPTINGNKDTNSPADQPFNIVENLLKKKGFSFEESSLMSDFSRAYKEKWTSQGLSAVFGTFFMKSRIDSQNSDLESIFRHALKDGGERSRSVMIDLGWIDKSNELRRPFDSMVAIKAAYDTVQNPENDSRARLG